MKNKSCVHKHETMMTFVSGCVHFLTGVAFLVVIGTQASAAQAPLSVSIDIGYTPPPGADLGPNEYRAASSLTLTCLGPTGTETYSWQTSFNSPENQEVCYPYWPKRQGTSEVYGKVKVTFLSEEPRRDYIIRRLEISETGASAQAFTVTQFQYTKWEEHSDPSSTNSLLDLISNVTKVQMSSGSKAITVMCNDGVGRSGTFMAIHTQIERLKTEGVVDFFQYIKSARIQREGVVQSVDQYMLCHDVLADYIDSFSGYANFQDIV